MQNLVEQFPVEIQLIIRRKAFEYDRELFEQIWKPICDLSDESKYIHAVSRCLYRIQCDQAGLTIL